MRNRAGWLALSVLAAATLLMVFFVLPRISDDGQQLSEAINNAGETVKDAVSEKTPASEASKEQPAEVVSTPSGSAPADGPADAATPHQTAPAANPPSETAAAPVVPAFDVLRVEPDGCAVIAGRAEPDAMVEVTSGDKIVAAVKAGPSGDFALVLEQPLAAGDHELVLRATGKAGRTVVSEETATVSVPENAEGKLLAMVTKPGKVSRLINVPAAGAEPSATLAAAPAEDDTLPSPVLPALPGAASDLVAAAPTIAPAVSPVSGEAPAGAADIQVTAVEIEGNRLFIAGRAPSGASLLGFANDQSIGRAKATGEGNFVIEGSIDLPVGNHIIGVELLDSAGKTALRVEVPFNRPAGAQVAAVAGQEGPDVVSAIDGGAFDKLRNETGRAFALLKELYRDGRQPTPEELAAARSGTAIALKSLSEYRLPAGAGAAARDIVEQTAKKASEALAALDGLPPGPEAIAAKLPELASTIEAAVGPVIAESAENGDAQELPAEAGPKTIEQAPLTQAHNSVIIRRGDTLWQISRRVYGQGVRYTTIYLANQDQITNPDLIEPGQIFGVPDEALPDAEELHRKRLQKQQR